MEAVIMAAGKSTRTHPLTALKPKPLLKICGKTILQHNLEQLEGIVDEIIVVVNFKRDLIEEHLKGSPLSKKIRLVEQKECNGTGGAILAAKPFLKDRFIVMNGDDFFSKKDIERCIKQEYCVLGKEVDDVSRFGEIIVKGENVLDMKEKASNGKGIANTGVYVFNTSIFTHDLKKSKRGEYEIVDYVKYLGEKVKCVVVSDYWIPVTYPWSLLEANEFFLSRTKTKILGTVEKGATLKGEIIVGKNTIIKSGSYLEGPISIGEGCTIGPNCFIRGSTSLGDNVKVGNAVEIKNSIVGDKTSIGHLSYVGDSVIGDDVNFGAGTITANLRHDDKNVRSPVKGEMTDSARRKLGAIIGDGVHTGIHTSIYPGRKIWPGKYTVPGEIVKEDRE
jgi:UDP-N-acetylglucosamine diphosphorylase / glucose-1-phosphate thymidylyltransferase / UDP-N-acetylgalactosamine diphosphorylase / glucosamine-1-phosphate N-acetyltransferase / galactosamine-1-phosphate N-acetyltransferase